MNKQNVWTVEFWKPMVKTFGYLTLGFLALLIVLGGGFFWLSQISGFMVTHPSSVNETQIAKAGLETIQRMVGDATAWSLAIEQEYQQLLASKTITPLADNYDVNFVTTGTR